MVFSKLNGNIEYTENRKIDDEDRGHQSSLYEVKLFGKNLVIALGKPKYIFASRNIVFFPIYIVSTDDKIEGQMGIFEIHQEKMTKVLDEEGDIDIMKLGMPLFYSFAERMVRYSKSNVTEYLLQWNKKQLPKKDIDMDESDKGMNDLGASNEESSDDEDILVLKPSGDSKDASVQMGIAKKVLEKGIFIIDPETAQPPTLPQETDTEANDIKKAYKESSKHSWLQKFMKNDKYQIHPVEDNGDCFFAVVRDAFKQIGHITTVQKLRAVVANAATDEIFQVYHTIYTDIVGSIKETRAKMAQIKHIIDNNLKKRLKNARTASESAEIQKEIDIQRIEYSKQQHEKTGSEAELSANFGNQEFPSTLEQFREYIQTPQFWADSWAITVLEKELLVKIILLSEGDYNHGAVDSVMRCGDSHPDIQTTGSFAPNYYIMTSYSGNHYTLVSYKSKKIFKYNEIPYHIKILLVQKCLERNAGIYYLIQDFRNFKSSLGIEPDMGSPVESDGDEDMYANLYDPELVFMFHSKSEKTAKPGKGSGEKIPAAKQNEFSALGKIVDWRRKLDDSWDKAQFTVDHKKWASVEHYYQGSKFRKGFPDFYQQFSLDSDSEISKDIELAKSAGSKSGILKKKDIKEKVLRPKSITIDPDFYDQKRNMKERELAVQSKFAQNEDLKQMLLATRNAKLTHFIRGDKPETDEILMNVRQGLL